MVKNHFWAGTCPTFLYLIIVIYPTITCSQQYIFEVWLFEVLLFEVWPFSRSYFSRYYFSRSYFSRSYFSRSYFSKSYFSRSDRFRGLTFRGLRSGVCVFKVLLFETPGSMMKENREVPKVICFCVGGKSRSSLSSWIPKIWTSITWEDLCLLTQGNTMCDWLNYMSITVVIETSRCSEFDLLNRVLPRNSCRVMRG